MNYCDLLHREQNMTLQKKFDCYRKQKVDIKHFGKEECDYSINPSGIASWYGPDYFNCIIKRKSKYVKIERFERNNNRIFQYLVNFKFYVIII